MPVLSPSSCFPGLSLLLPCLPTHLPTMRPPCLLVTLPEQWAWWTQCRRSPQPFCLAHAGDHALQPPALTIGLSTSPCSPTLWQQSLSGIRAASLGQLRLGVSREKCSWPPAPEVAHHGTGPLGSSLQSVVPMATPRHASLAPLWGHTHLSRD